MSDVKSSLSERNRAMYGQDEYSKAQVAMIEREKLARLAVCALSGVKCMLDNLSHVDSIPVIVSSVIPAIREISSRLYTDYPVYSVQLSEASSVLGGVLADSAIITGARFDFKRSNSSSSAMLDEAKLVVDSKLSKLYPNLDYTKDSV